MGSPNLPSVAGRLQAAAAVAQEGPISISVPPSALPSQLSAVDVSSLDLAATAVFYGIESWRLESWLRHESTIRSTSCSANIVISAGLAYLSMPTANLARHRGSDCCCCCPRALMRLRFKQSIPRRPRPLASRGISWQSAGHSSGPQSGLAKQAKHHQAPPSKQQSGPRLVAPCCPCWPCCCVPPQRSFFVSFLAVSRLLLLVFQGWPDSALPAAPKSVSCRSPEMDRQCQSVGTDASSFPLRLGS